MDRVVCGELWPELQRLWKKTGNRRAAVAYVSDDTRLRFGGGDTLVVDASDRQIRGGQTSAKVLRRAHKRGVNLFHRDGLHAKVYLFDDSVVIGSANCSQNSCKQVEAALVSTNRSVLAQAAGLIEKLSDRPSVPIDEPFLKRIERIKVLPRRAGNARHRGPRVGSQRAWIVSVHGSEPTDEEQAFIDEAFSEAKATCRTVHEENYVHCRGSTRFTTLARPGDLISVVFRDTPSSRTVSYVYRPVPIICKKAKKSETVFYYALSSSDGRKTKRFREFCRLCKTVGVRRRITPTSDIEIRPPCLAVDLDRAWDRKAKK